MRKVVLPKILMPRACTLVRVGSKFDGGYLLPPAMIDNCEEVLSLGANYDISFEQQLLAEKKLKVVIVDASVMPIKLLKSALKSLLLGRFKDTIRYTFSIFDQWALRIRHNQVKFRYDFVGSLEEQISLSDVINSDLVSDKIVISCDIEGDEYRILSDILAVQSRLCGLVIEFHDCDIHQDKIENFINNFELDICHVHVNNCGPVSKSAFPTGLEVIFSRYWDGTKESLRFPNLMDAPCNPNHEDIRIMFEADCDTVSKSC
ncbi:hypothetical protein N9Q54_00685 [Octadecabacter sp.]|nr:hypothetical protein [Octadecabacter sp.]